MLHQPVSTYKLLEATLAQNLSIHVTGPEISYGFMLSTVIVNVIIRCMINWLWN